MHGTTETCQEGDSLAMISAWNWWAVFPAAMRGPSLGTPNVPSGAILAIFPSEGVVADSLIVTLSGSPGRSTYAFVGGLSGSGPGSKISGSEREPKFCSGPPAQPVRMVQSVRIPKLHQLRMERTTITRSLVPPPAARYKNPIVGQHFHIVRSRLRQVYDHFFTGASKESYTAAVGKLRKSIGGFYCFRNGQAGDVWSGPWIIDLTFNIVV